MSGRSFFNIDRFFDVDEKLNFESIFSDPSVKDIWTEFDRVFSALGSNSSFPPYNIHVLKDGSARIEVALAGYEQKNLSISILDRKITINGEKKKKEGEGEEIKCTAYLGIKEAKFSLTIPMEARFNLNKTTAKMKDGLLILQVPLVEERKESAININIASE